MSEVIFTAVIPHPLRTFAAEPGDASGEGAYRQTIMERLFGAVALQRLRRLLRRCHGLRLVVSLMPKLS